MTETYTNIVKDADAAREAAYKANAGEPLTDREIAALLGVCWQRVREIHLRALKKLKTLLREA